jgi:hypothetical protein
LIKSLWTLINFVVNTPYPGQVPMQVVWSNQNSARVDKPYVVLDYTSVDVPDHEYYGQVNDVGYATVASWRKAVVSAQFYAGPDSYNLASRFVGRLAMEYSLGKQVELDCSIGTRLMLARIPVVLNESQFEDRAIYTFEFYYTESQDEFVSLIETVIVTGEYEGATATDGVTCTEVITIAPVATPLGDNNG